IRPRCRSRNQEAPRPRAMSTNIPTATIIRTITPTITDTIILTTTITIIDRLRRRLSRMLRRTARPAESTRGTASCRDRALAELIDADRDLRHISCALEKGIRMQLRGLDQMIVATDREILRLQRMLRIEKEATPLSFGARLPDLISIEEAR